MRFALLASALEHAQKGEFPQMLAICEEHLRASKFSDAALAACASLSLEFGFVTKARDYYLKLLESDQQSVTALAGLAKVATETGDHGLASRIYSELVAIQPDHPVIRRNALVALQYDPAVAETDRYEQAIRWGQWAEAKAGGLHDRPAIVSLSNRVPRVGFVSADLCQHTVGLFAKDVLQALGKQWPVFIYSAREHEDWVSRVIKTSCTWRNVATLDDLALVAQIKADEIDILVDMSGHTSGSRLTAFAHRPAPVMVSWLGYFATTGLKCMDAVLLDPWHTSDDAQSSLVEPIESLPQGRFFYRPVPWAPKQISDLPSLNKEYVTFGCFNNTAKLNQQVYEVWSQILHAVPDSRLALKWRTFNDPDFRESVLTTFAKHGVSADRIELRGSSFHVDVLKEYADIDIALDPFPFTGGLTSCEALWMGVPVVTLPQAPVVSRQTFAFLKTIGLDECCAQSADDYVAIAMRLAKNAGHLTHLRQSLRGLMQASSLMNLDGFVTQFQQALLSVHRRVVSEQTSP